MFYVWQVGGPKHAPLGGDRDGNLYWCFAGSDKLFVSAPPVRRHATTTAASTPKATSAAAAAATTLYIAVPPPPAALHNVGLSQPLIPPELSGCQVSATCSCSDRATTRCASGSTPTGSRPII